MDPFVKFVQFVAYPFLDFGENLFWQYPINDANLTGTAIRIYILSDVLLANLSICASAPVSVISTTLPFNERCRYGFSGS